MAQTMNHRLDIGRLITGLVSSRQSFGVFVNLGDNVFGLLQLPYAPGRDGERVLPEVGSTVTAVVIGVRPTTAGTQVALSMRQEDLLAAQAGSGTE